MKFKGLIGSMNSGSAGGLTASHNRGGYYLRNRAVPTDPATHRQLEVRSLMSLLSAAWTANSDANRAGWDVYALNTPLTNVLGDPINVGGKGMYIRGNLPRLYCDDLFGSSLGRIDIPPTDFGLPGATASATALDQAADTVEVTFDNTDSWATLDKGALLVYSSRPLPAAVNFFKGPWQLSGRVDGATMTPPTSPQDVDLAFPIIAGQRVSIRLVAVTTDGRMTADLFNGILTG